MDIEHYAEWRLPDRRRALTRVWMNNGACHSCETRAKDTRRRPILPREWVLPLVPCSLGGLNHTCPRQQRQYLNYFFGEDLNAPSWLIRGWEPVLMGIGVWLVAGALFATARKVTGSDLGVQLVSRQPVQL